MKIKTPVGLLYAIRTFPLDEKGQPTGGLFQKIISAVSSDNHAILRLSRVMDCLLEEVTAIEKQRMVIYKKYADEEKTKEGHPTGKLIVRKEEEEQFRKEITDFMESEEEFKLDYLLDVDDLNKANISLSVPEIKILDPILDKRKLNLRMKQRQVEEEKELAELEKLPN